MFSLPFLEGQQLIAKINAVLTSNIGHLNVVSNSIESMARRAYGHNLGYRFRSGLDVIEANQWKCANANNPTKENSTSE